MVDSMMREWGSCMEGSAVGVYSRAHEGWTMGTDALVKGPVGARPSASDCASYSWQASSK